MMTIDLGESTKVGQSDFKFEVLLHYNYGDVPESCCLMCFPKDMSQAEQVPEDMPAYLNSEPVETGKCSHG